MSYLVLARKSRPQFFREVVGQKPIVRTLQNALLHDRVAHALIFSGVRGTGKTTLARIMAKAINCENRKDAEPCGICNACRQIGEGSSVDLQEVDGASNRGIQEIRELKEKIRFMPTSSRYKIIIIDEVHMLTTEAFNALLKTLEEPPAHVFFMFATTELHKVPVTILSRCQRYELKRISRSELFSHFDQLSRGEGVEVEKGALDLIVRESGGSVRDGLSLLDQVFSYCGEKVTTEEVSEVLGLVNRQAVSQLIKALLAKDTALVFSLLDSVFAQGVDVKRLSADLLEWIRNLIICKINAASELLDLPEDDIAVLHETAVGYSYETLTAMFALLLEGLERVNYSSYSRLSLELIFIKIIQAGDIVPVSELLARFDRLLAGVPEAALRQVPPQGLVTVDTVVPEGNDLAKKTERRPQQVPRGESCSPAYPDKEAERPPAEEKASHISADQPPEGVQSGEQSVSLTKADVRDADSVEREVQSEHHAAEQVEEQREETKQVKSVQGVAKKDIRRDWDGFLAYVRDRQPWTSATLQRASTVKRVDDEVVIQFDDSADCALLKTKQYIKPLNEFLMDFFQEELTIRFDVPGDNQCAISPENGKQPRQERKALANDPLVLTAVEIFNGQVGDIRIGPRFRKKIDQENSGEVEQSSQEI